VENQQNLEGLGWVFTGAIESPRQPQVSEPGAALNVVVQA